jgi:hypothetical protein
MDRERITFTDLANHVQPYEYIPTMLPAEMQENIWRIMLVNSISIPFLLLVPSVLNMIAYSGFYTLGGELYFSADILFGLAELLIIIAPWLIGINILGLITCGYVYWQSKGMTYPIPYRSHQMAMVATYPANAVVILAGGITMIFAVVSVLSIVMWLVIIALACLFIFIVFEILLG